MSGHRASRLAAGLLGLTLVALAVAVWLSLQPQHASGRAPAPAPFVPDILSFAVIGLLVARRRPRNPIGWLFLANALVPAVDLLAQAYARYGLDMSHALPASTWAAWLGNSLIEVGVVPRIFALLLFPHGQLLSPRWRLVGWVAVGNAIVGTLATSVADLNFSSNYRDLRDPVQLFAGETVRPIYEVHQLLLLAVFLLAAASLVARLVRSRGEERQQLKWFVYAVALSTSGLLVAAVALPNPVVASIVLGPLVPIAAGVAILKYRLYDIDVVINKSLVFGALAAFITAVYVAIVVGIGALIGTAGKPNLALSLLATALVALAFQPVRDWVQRVANRLVYGQRATPYEVMAEFSHGMATVLSTEELLPRMAEAAGRGVSARQVRVTLFLTSENQAVTWPTGATPTPVDRLVPIVYAGSSIGEIAVAMPQGASLRPSDVTLLTDLAVQAGLALHSVRLTLELRDRLEEISQQAAQLRASRNRIVSAQDTERRRLEQSIQAGVHGELTTLAGDLRAIEPLLRQDPALAASRLTELAEACNRMLEKLRDLARGIYPPLLRDHGLVAALRAQITKLGILTEVQAEGVGRYPEQVEAAVYFACIEALTGGGSPAAITLTATGGRLTFVVEGVELPAARRQDIEDRVESLGGQVQPRGRLGIAAELPVQEPESVALAPA